MDLKQLLLKYWGHSQFRPLQEEIIHSILEGNDTLALLPTGGGKSICFQIPALAQEGICVVISPLIALMKDQVENLLKRNIKAVAIHSGMSKREVDIVLDNCAYGDIKLLYVSPERLETEIFKERFKKMKVSFIAIDEAHCISEWGYDFRPSYLNIAKLREQNPTIPFLALTATATKEVVIDIQKQLGFKKDNVLQKSFERKNLGYVVVKEENKLERLLILLKKIDGTAIIYVRSRKKTKEIASFLYKNSVSVDFYHAGLSNDERTQKQHNWMNNKTRVIVSTNAFGMGIDKANVRLVVHLDLPDSLEAYFQEAGRAGRDEEKAYAILLFEEADRMDIEQRVVNSFPDIEMIKNVYQALANFYQIPVGSGLNQSYLFNISDFSKQYNLTVYSVFNCLKFLEKEGYLILTEAYYSPSKIKMELKKDDLYEFQVKNKKYDLFIKTILRAYAGLFENYIKIDEFEIAKNLKTSRDTVVKVLSYLKKLNVIDYVEQTSLPQLIYSTARIDVNNLSISKQHYHDRKVIAIKKMESVIHYATTNHKCRSQILLAYFGEKDTYRCGICDVCLERNKLELSDIEFSSVSDQIKSLLGRSPMPITELMRKIDGVRENKSVKVIQWLTDNNKLVYNDENLLEWRK